MSEPRQTVVRFVRAVASAERGCDRDLPDAEVATRIMARLYRQLSKLVGPGGFDVLLARSVVLARRAHPAIAGVAAGTAGALTGLDAAHDAALGEGAMAIVAHFMELLATLIGEDLATGLLRRIWPAAGDEEER
jgi:hypothetical protein